MDKFRSFSFCVIVFIAFLGLDNSVVSYNSNNTTYLEKELDMLWKEHDPAGKEVFLERVEKRLPNWENLFKEAANLSEIHWTLLAAISYQESHWNPKAISKTGVRGLMMLTQTTAKEVGILRRTDPVQSVLGGSIYIHKLIERFPNSVPRQDKLWMTIAAYNLGFTYVKEAREEAKANKMNPDSWEDVSKTLFLLGEDSSNENMSRRIKEALDYVFKVQLYFQTLSVLVRNSNEHTINS